ncbi:lipopolysaccharide-induced tumor necrosis factor-alpha factor homolog isoform X1 [Scleropages formosus]|uniref:HUWE1 associated protein modifying stress responses n=1 Tax=Scleropages formosus TaxID=113540 RepID=A0A8D0CJK5_SCLFO|nr:lipopolysaccharide-induced tumor necrosis factor-alpha factor homolog isoform X1 [Scleropages formosus]XP_018595093.1 lipopolysaccharide-induced tumor necrosis factor-alpha factor homolog isoform X1 [Scleropages formosus]
MTKAQKTEEIDTSSSPYTIPVDEEVKVYHLHPPFSSSRISRDDSYQTVSLGDATNKKFVSYETNLGRSQGMATCPSCKQQVLTNVTYKIGVFAWLMCLVFILCGLVVGCCLIPFFVKHFKDVYHSCPRCYQILHVEKKSCF